MSAAAATTTQSAAEALGQLASLKGMLASLEEALREKAVVEGTRGGMAPVVRPFSFRVPRKVGGEVDPFFGMAYHQWMDLKKAGFKGFFSPGRMESERSPLFVIYERAAAFLDERMAAQEGALVSREARRHFQKEKKKKGEAGE